MFKRLLIGLVTALIVLGGGGAIALYIAAQQAGQPPEVGAPDGQLAPCASTPNCAASQGVAPEGLLPPLTFIGDPAAAQARLLTVLQAQPRTQIISERPGYIHAIFRSPTFGFPNDTEFVVDASANTIFFRSQARMGRGDQGKNREFIEQVRAAFTQTP